VIHVSTDSIKILKIAKKLKINVDFLRPKKLSNDTTSLLKVIKFVIDKFKKKNFFFQQVCIFMPCSPLILKKNLLDASHILRKKNNLAFTSVVQNSNHPQWSFFIKNSYLHPIDIKSLTKRSQQLKKTYFDVGLLAGWKTSYFLENYKKIKNYKFSPLILNRFQSVDIDNIDDWKFAEIIYKNRLHKKKLY
jgi:CMP-N-acetylneuraminic acid synthetase